MGERGQWGEGLEGTIKGSLGGSENIKGSLGGRDDLLHGLLHVNYLGQWNYNYL